MGFGRNYGVYIDQEEMASVMMADNAEKGDHEKAIQQQGTIDFVSYFIEYNISTTIGVDSIELLLHQSIDRSPMRRTTSSVQSNRISWSTASFFSSPFSEWFINLVLVPRISPPETQWVIWWRLMIPEESFWLHWFCCRWALLVSLLCVSDDQKATTEVQQSCKTAPGVLSPSTIIDDEHIDEWISDWLSHAN